jgi:hypothetical protein
VPQPVKPAPAPAPVKVIAAAPPPAPAPVPPKKSAPVIVATRAEAPQQVTYHPLSSLNKKSSSWGWMKSSSTANTPKPARASKKAPVVRGQTLYLPGVR